MKINSIISLSFFVAVLFYSRVAYCADYEATVVSDEEYYIANEAFEPDCSIYCTIPKPSYTSTSHLIASGVNTYTPDKINDWNLKTAWVEGSEEYGVGEKIKTCFDLKTVNYQRYGIDEIFVVNGYRKSQEIWAANSRVKSLLLKIDGSSAGVINLKDTPKLQSVKMPMHMLVPGAMNCYEFEILSVYEGGKHKDTAITELYFSGVGSH